MPTDSAALRLLPHLRRAALTHHPDTADAQLLGAFVATRDEAAFAALVRRHGPMVLGVCRRVVGDSHLAEDAFQATFLVLARRAATVVPRHLVGPWLYGVAYRTALKARGSALRVRAKEKQVDAMPQPPVSPDDAWADLQPVLDTELARLPDKYRVPVVLCDLGGRPQRQVARDLGIPAATLANRLAAARRLLAKRLTARGVALSAAAVGSALGWHAATSAVPPALATSTVKAACAAAAGTAVGLPVPVVQLSEGVMRMFVLNKLKAVATGLVTCLALLAGLGLVAGPSLWAGPEEKPAAPKPVPKADPAKPATPEKPSDDLTFLRRTSLDLRGIPPTPLEVHYFLADADPKKRAKVTEWMLPEHGRQKVTAACQTCHKLPADWHSFRAVPELNELFHNGHDVAITDVDNNGKPDLYVFNQLYPYERLSILWETKDDPNVARLRAELDAARAIVANVEAEVKLAEKKAAQGPAAGKVNLEPVRARLAQAQANVQAAEQRLKEAEAKRAATTFVDWAGGLHDPNSSAPILIDPFLFEPSKALWGHGTVGQPTDAEFLRRVMLDVAGRSPTTVEEKYFEADQDPQKREKLLKHLAGYGKPATAAEKMVQDLLADPEVQKRWAELYQQRIYAEQLRAAHDAWETKAHFFAGGRLDKLLGELLDGKRGDDQVLDALCLATLARFPTETERKLILEGVKGQSDRRAAWQGVLKALATTAEAKAHGAELGQSAK
jgi:RNA polymerase sigma factor (sigma-70 family)